MVFLRPLPNTKGGTPLQNVAASDDVHYDKYDIPSQKHNWGNGISNAIFHNDAGHIFLKTAIQVFNRTFINGQWASSGPVVLTKALDEICGQEGKKRPLNPIDHGRQRCNGFAVVEPRLFYPFDWFNAGGMTNKQLNTFWDERFKKSYVAHFYGTSSKSSPKILRPNNYGKAKPAYAYLGPTHCPVSFFSTRPF